MRNSSIIPVIAASAVLSLSSCRRIPLYDDKSNYRIAIDTRYSQLYNIPDQRNRPKLYKVNLYNPETGQLMHSNTVGEDGGFLYDVEPGSYDILVYDYTHNRTDISHEDDRDAAVAQSTKVGYSGMPVVESPDHLYVQTFGSVDIPYLTENDETWVLRSNPESIVESWLLCIDGIKGLEYADAINCYVTGQVASKYLYSGAPHSSECCIFFNGETNLEKGVIETPFNTFGRLRERAAQLIINLVIEGSGGDTYICRDDVTWQFDDSWNTDKIIRATFDVTIKPRQDSGFNPSAEDWDPDVTVIDLT